MKFNIGIIGKGFVGSAVSVGFSPSTGFDSNIRSYDKVEHKSTHSLEETVNESSVVFISVPTPSLKTGQIDLSIVESLFEDISKVNRNSENVFLLRSTVVPGTSKKIADKFPNLNIVFNPEFLTERSAYFDFINQSRVILGGNKKHTTIVAELYKSRFGDYLPIIQTDYQTAEMIKYMNNLFFATKVSFLNEMYQIADKSNVDWKTAVEGFILDGRIGHSHLQVPGPDGKFGFGGSCFPKDIQALITYAQDLGINPSVLIGAWEKNLDVRPERDWEALKGRAVSE
tara:strand:+ start:367 stop:1221 length:855 start_codon:yes stop_codon:yes gene_type:complete